MDKKKLLIGAAVLVAVYLAYRWYAGRQQQSQATQGEGTNLNSSFPALVAGSTGPASGINYTSPPINVTITQPMNTAGTNTSAAKGA